MGVTSGRLSGYSIRPFPPGRRTRADESRARHADVAEPLRSGSLIEPRCPSAAPVQPTGIVWGGWPNTVTTARRTGTCSRTSVRSPVSGNGSQASAGGACAACRQLRLQDQHRVGRSFAGPAMRMSRTHESDSGPCGQPGATVTRKPQAVLDLAAAVNGTASAGSLRQPSISPSRTDPLIDWSP